MNPIFASNADGFIALATVLIEALNLSFRANPPDLFVPLLERKFFFPPGKFTSRPKVIKKCG